MTPEQLQQIKERVNERNGESLPWTEIDSALLVEDALKLLAHVEQLEAEPTDEYSCLTKALAVIEKHLPNTEDLYRELSAFQRSICK